MAKYDALRDFLRYRFGAVTLTFDDIADLVGGLPKSASEHRQWWENDAGHVQARAWIEAGHPVETVDIDRREVRFASRTGRRPKRPCADDEWIAFPPPIREVLRDSFLGAVGDGATDLEDVPLIIVERVKTVVNGARVSLDTATQWVTDLYQSDSDGRLRLHNALGGVVVMEWLLYRMQGPIVGDDASGFEEAFIRDLRAYDLDPDEWLVRC